MSANLAGGSEAPGPDRHAFSWLVVALACVVASPIASYVSQQTDGAAKVSWFVVQVVATALAFAIPQFQQIAARRGEQTAEEREVEVRVDTRATVNDALDPVLRQLATISVEPDRAERDKL